METHQAGWEFGLLKAWARATGPKTPEGQRRSRFNALKHGLFARTATYFPARPGGYAQCEGCDLRDTVCHEQVACLRRTELFLKHHAAFEAGDPGMLTALRADTQAAVQALINDMILAISADGGPRIKEISWYYDKDGGFHLAQWLDEHGELRQIYELKAHPLLKVLIDFLARNSMSLADMEMTPKSQDEAEQMRGYLDGAQGAQHDALEFQRRQTAALEGLREMIARSQEKTRRDPVLIEHGEMEQDGGG